MDMKEKENIGNCLFKKFKVNSMCKHYKQCNGVAKKSCPSAEISNVKIE